jgi:hypothetical protein
VDHLGELMMANAEDGLYTRIEQLESAVATATTDLERLRSATHTAAVIRRAACAVAAALVAIAATPAGTRIVAPFRVVDGSGKLIAAVLTNPARFLVYNEAGTEALQVVGGNSSFFKALSPNGRTVTVMGVDSGKTPLISLRTAGGHNNRLALAVADGKSSLVMSSKADISIVDIGEGAHGGAFQLSDAGGTLAVEAGITPTGVGVVRTHPQGNMTGGNFVGAGILGLPTSTICGAGCNH